MSDWHRLSRCGRPKSHQGGGRDGGSKGTRKETRNLRLKACMDAYGPLKIREFSMYYLAWHKIKKEKRAHIMEWLMEEMLRMRDLGANTPSCVPYTKEETMYLVIKGKQRGHILGVDRVLTGKGKTAIFIDKPREIDGGSKSGSGEGGDDELGEDEDASRDEDVDGDDDI
uniref:Uncharacterized protein n=1 Tax=Tanacetum cinerariifolium TaxID=118510 RepID=A0A6L2L2J1_TANCI|nr:hypothetical protein [Tanacetum cinerariifolium]